MSYQILESKHDGLQAIKLTDEPYEGIIYSYGKVDLVPDEENDQLTIKFDYEIHDRNDKSFDEEIFQNYIGQVLQRLIYEGVEANSLTYVGGVDEN
jgi:hypothetical protein